MFEKGLGAYRKAQAQELDQAQLILMMYRGAINFLNKALVTEETDNVQMSFLISKAKNVILELMLSLNIEEGGDMANMLLQMYQRLFRKLNIAHMKDDRIKVAEVRDSLSELEDTWCQIFRSKEYGKFKKSREQSHIRVCAR